MFPEMARECAYKGAEIIASSSTGIFVLSPREIILTWNPAMERMTALPWPGNVRQLENFLAQAVVLVESDMLTERDLFVEQPVSPGIASPSALQLEPGLPLREVERRHILSTLQRAQGNRTEAAKLLGISVRCLQYKLKAYAQTVKGLTATDRMPVVDADVIMPPPSREQILAL